MKTHTIAMAGKKNHNSNIDIVLSSFIFNSLSRESIIFIPYGLGDHRVWLGPTIKPYSISRTSKVKTKESDQE